MALSEEALQAGFINRQRRWVERHMGESKGCLCLAMSTTPSSTTCEFNMLLRRRLGNRALHPGRAETGKFFQQTRFELRKEFIVA